MNLKEIRDNARITKERCNDIGMKLSYFLKYCYYRPEIFRMLNDARINVEAAADALATVEEKVERAIREKD